MTVGSIDEEMHERLTRRFTELRLIACDGALAWTSSPETSALGSDAFRAVRSTPVSSFSAITRALLTQSIVPTMADLGSLREWISVHHGALRTYRESSTFWALLASGLTMIDLCGGIPTLSTDPRLLLDYDALLILLSPLYADLRVAAYNDGVEVHCVSGNYPWFNPELREIPLTSNYIAEHADGMKHTLSLNVNHDCCHIVPFGDGYLPGAFSSTSERARSFIAIEESAIALDLPILQEVLSIRSDLDLLGIYSKVETATRHGQESHFMQHTAKDRQQLAAATRQLRARALHRHATGSHLPLGPTGVWVSEGAVESHVRYWTQYADYAAWAYKEMAASGIVRDRSQVSRAHRATRLNWADEISSPTIAAFDPQVRADSKARHRLIRRGQALADAATILGAPFDDFSAGLEPLARFHRNIRLGTAIDLEAVSASAVQESCAALNTRSSSTAPLSRDLEGRLKWRSRPKMRQNR